MEKKCYLFEEWKDIPGYEGLYQASTFGRIKSLPRYCRCRGNKTRPVLGKIMSPGTQKEGYLHVVLRKNGKYQTHKVHRLVALTWIPNPQNLPCVNHKDCNRSNNVVSNLEWCTQQYNVTYRDAQLRRIETMKHRRRIKKVYQYTLEGEFVAEWEDTHHVEKETGWLQSNISACCRGKRKQYHGYIWKYA